MNHAPEEQLKIVIVGHVDHGKSTLVGRIIHDSGSLPEGKLEHLQRIAQARGVPFEWANLMDSLQAERDQNITIDTTQIWFRTQKRQYVLIDAPGHKEFLKNMVTGAAGADAALLLLDASEGVQEQSRRHGYLLHLLGIKQVNVIVNKLDLIDYSQDGFERLEKDYRRFLETVGLKPRLFVPVSAREGENVAAPSAKMPWHHGPTVLQALDSFLAAPSLQDRSLRYVIQDIYRFDERRILAGRIESGTLRVGDRLLFSPGNKVSTVKSIERWNAQPSDTAISGESIGITLSDQLFVERGAVASLEDDSPFELATFRARIFWLGRNPLVPGRNYKLKLAAQEVPCEVSEIHDTIDASTLSSVTRPGMKSVARHEVAEITIHTRKAIAFDVHSSNPAMGRFVLVDGFDVAGGGIIVESNYPHRTADSLHKSTNIYWSEGEVTEEERTHRNGYPGCIVWLTGITASGKSTIARRLERVLFNLGKHVYVLDGDKVRHGLSSDLAFTPEERKENIRRVGEVARLFADSGAIVISAFISPYRSDRDHIRSLTPTNRFIEVFLNPALEVCEQRDPKGLYAKARAGEIKEFTGITAPYETPLSPEIELKTDELSVEDSVLRIVEFLSRLK